MSGAGPLAGVKVLDFTTTFSGPYCTRALADLGADVLKIEAPGGDITRRLGTIRDDMGSVYAAVNRDKASVELDLRGPDRRTVEHLIDAADCLVHNMRPAAAARLSLDAETTLARNPRLIHASITGYGTDGPYAGRPAYDDCIQAMSGLASLQSDYADAPQYMATSVADKVAGMAAAQAVLAAMVARDRTGRGQSVEVPMFETLVGFALMEQWGGRAFAPSEGPTGYRRMQARSRRPYRTADGLVSVVVYHQAHWERFLSAVGRTDVFDDPRFAAVDARNRNIEALYEILETILADRTTADWLQLFERIDVPAARVATPSDVLDDPHLTAVEFFHTVRTPRGDYVSERAAARFSDTPTTPPSARPGPSPLGGDDGAVERWLKGHRPT